MAIPDYQSLMLPVLEAAQQGETSAREAAKKIIERFNISEEEQSSLLPSGRQAILSNRIHWAKFYLTKAGLLSSPRRGIFFASPAGLTLLKTKPTKITTRFLQTIPVFQEFYTRDIVTDTDSTITNNIENEGTPEEAIDRAHQVLDQALRADLLERVLANSPAFFEWLIIELLVKMGYGGTHSGAAKQLGRSGDGGVDGIINEDALGLDRVYIQAKRFAQKSTVGRPDIQAFAGSLLGLNSAKKGIFVTTARFSSKAVEYISTIPQRVVLIDGNRLTELMLEYGVGLREHRTVEIKKIDESFFMEEF